MLDEAERYGDAMELPMLTAEVYFVHSQILRTQGETALAGDKATRALQIATLNGLVLRSITYRNALAHIHREREWTEEADRMRSHVQRAAANAG
jgi:hypothetical protein